MHSSVLVVVLVGLPALGALGLAAARGVDRTVAVCIAMLVALAELAGVLVLAVGYDPNGAAFQNTATQAIAPSFGLVWRSGTDGISLLLVVLTAIIVPVAIVGAPERLRTRASLGWLLLLEAATVGSFVSLDVLLFFLFFELTLVPAYFLIAGWGDRERGPAAAMKFFVYTLVGSAFLFVGILALAFLHQSQAGGPLTFSLTSLSDTHLSGTTGVLLFCAFTAAFVVKAPIFPFHTWSPDAYSEAPIAGSVVLSALLAKLGTYGILRFDITLFPHAFATVAPWLLGLAVASILYGALVACGSVELKRLLAYSSLAQMGFIVLGTASLNTNGVTGAVLQMFNHGIIIAALFLLVGFVAARTGTTFATSLRGPPGPRAGARGRLHDRHARLDRPAGPERLRGRVPHARRLLRRARLVGDPADDRGRRRGPLPALGLPAGLPGPDARRARRGSLTSRSTSAPCSRRSSGSWSSSASTRSS